MSDLRATRLADLWTRHLAGDELSAEDGAQLTEAFQHDEVFRRRVLHDLRLEGALRSLAEVRKNQPRMLRTMDQLVRAAAQSEGFVMQLRARLAAEQAPRRVWARRALVGGGVAAAAAAVVAAFVGLRREAPRPHAARHTPSVAARAMSRTPASRMIVPPGEAHKRAVLLLGSDDPSLLQPPRASLGDEPLRARLENLGFTVDVVTVDDPDSPVLESLRRAQVAVLSPSIATAELNEDIVSMPVPMVALESSAFSRLGLTGYAWQRDVGNRDGRTSDVVIAHPEHPLAAGLSGQRAVLDRRLTLRWGAPGEEAIIIARYPHARPGQGAIFAYERGSHMPGGTAAARRVALFLGNGRVIRSLSPDGWKLFDAAVTWSVGK
jgi:hypothetical protein